MAGAPVGMCLRCPAVCMFPSHLPSFLHLSFQDLSRRSKSAPMPSCLSSTVLSCPCMTLPKRNYEAFLLPSSLCSLSPTSWLRSSSVDAGNGKIVGLTMDLKGKSHNLMRAAKRKNSRTAGTNVRSMSGQSAVVLEETIKRKNSQNAVVVYSKSWCPYCSMVKGLFTKLRVSFEVVELDQLVDEQDFQEALRRLTGQSTVPNVFVGGKHIGGCDDTMALHKKGGLIPALEAAGLKITAA